MLQLLQQAVLFICSTIKNKTKRKHFENREQHKCWNTTIGKNKKTKQTKNTQTTVYK